MDDTVLKLLVLRELLNQSGSDDSSSSAKNTSLLEVGLKVVRGPDWKWENQDGGEGHVGTVVEVGRSNGTLDKQVFVVWDNGVRGNYRIGYSGAYDLRTLDNGSIGVNHPTVTCNSCRKKGVVGMRWKCKVCYDYDLCTRCYMSDKHDTAHAFTRFQTNNGNQVDMPKRQDSVKILMRGIFASAKVVRGQDWKWERQDGGSNRGRVTDVCGWDDNTDWNACHVTWSHNDSSNLYRIGYEGKVDLKYVEDASDGYYYRDHLPITGDEQRAVSANTQIKEIYERRNSGVVSRAENISTTIKEFGSSTGSALLSQNLKDLFFSDQFSDLTLKVQERSFKAHKAILCARSAVFASKILGDNTGSSIIVIRDCDPGTFEDVLFYLYTGKLKRLSHANVIALSDAADKFEIAALKEECVRFKKEGLSVDYVSDFLAVA